MVTYGQLLIVYGSRDQRYIFMFASNTCMIHVEQSLTHDAIGRTEGMGAKIGNLPCCSRAKQYDAIEMHSYGE